METEEEQVERLKAWLKENGMSIVFGIIIGVGGIGGYKYWTERQETIAAEASGHYVQMIAALDGGNSQLLNEQADILIAEYGATDYALLAQLALASNHVASGNFEQAALALQQVVGSAGQEPLAYVARTRLAAVHIQTGQIDQALATLEAEFPDEFAARVAELRGDAYASQGKVAQAIEAYRAAQTAAAGPANETFLQQKLDDLGARD